MPDHALPIPGFSEPFSSLTHLIGAGVFAVLGVLLVRRGRGDNGRMISLAVFAFACVLQLSMSGVYHLLEHQGRGRSVLQRLDHAAIFVLIAATFTPTHVILFRGPLRWAMLGSIWIPAITGLTLKTIFFDSLPEGVGLTFYLSLGWLGVFSAFALWRRFGFTLIGPLAWGALAYTAGALMEFFRTPVLIPFVVGPHEMFHVCVLAGIACHWRFIFRFAAGVYRPPVEPNSMTLLRLGDVVGSPRHLPAGGAGPALWTRLEANPDISI